MNLLSCATADEVPLLDEFEAATHSLEMGGVAMSTPQGTRVTGTLSATHYALRFLPNVGIHDRSLRLVPHSWWVIPLLLVRKLELLRPGRGQPASVVRLHCKDVRSPYMAFRSPEDASQAVKLVSSLAFPKLHHSFAFASVPRHNGGGALPGWFDTYIPAEEFARQGALAAVNPISGQPQWRITTVNDQYCFSPTYPHQLVVPAAISDGHLVPLQRFRSKGRIPALTWRYRVNGTAMLRSSQPRIGVYNASCAEDQQLLSAVKATSDAYIRGLACARQLGRAGNAAPAPAPATTPARPPAPAPAPTMSASAALAAARRTSSARTAVAVPAAEADPHNPFSSMGGGGSGSPAGGSSPRDGGADTPVNTALWGDASGALSPALVSTPKLLIADCRPSTNAMAQKAGGWGYEAYPDCETVFLGIHNIHEVRAAFRRMEALVRKTASADTARGTPTPEDLTWGEQLERTGWPSMLRCILGGALRVAWAMEEHGRSVLVHCSDGWDRTAQVCGLVQVLLDPYFRTTRGLCALVAKEWCTFGHKFQQRLGLGDVKFDEDGECSPVFIQFLDCLWQLVTQFPALFEYTPRLLRALAHHAYSCRFGTFLGNCENERRSAALPQKTQSLWTWVLGQVETERRLMQASSTLAPGEEGVGVAHVAGFLNPAYAAGTADAVLLPPPSVVLRKVCVWEDWWCRWGGMPWGGFNTAAAVGPPGDTSWGVWAHDSRAAGGGDTPPAAGAPQTEEGSRCRCVGPPPTSTTMSLERSPYGKAAAAAGAVGGGESPPPTALACPWLRYKWKGDGLGHVPGSVDTALAPIDALRKRGGLPPLSAATAAASMPPERASANPAVALQPPALEEQEEAPPTPPAAEGGEQGPLVQQAPPTPAAVEPPPPPTMHTGPNVDPFTGQPLGGMTVVAAVPALESAAEDESVASAASDEAAD